MNYYYYHDVLNKAYKKRPIDVVNRAYKKKVENLIKLNFSITNECFDST